MRFLPVLNPPNPWASSVVEYLEEPPTIGLEVYEDHSRSILSKNDSPDLPFTYSVNPYRGCLHSCSYCLSPETPILMADGTRQPMHSLTVGDTIYGTRLAGKHRYYVRTRVLDLWETRAAAFRIWLEDGTELIASSEHRFLSRRGWKFVTGSEHGANQRPHLGIGSSRLMGFGALPSSPSEDGDYMRGYLCGMIRGDETVGSYASKKSAYIHHQFRLALIDFEGLRRARQYLLKMNVETQEFVFQRTSGSRRRVDATRCQTKARVDQVRALCEWPADPSINWDKGFLAGIFDAEGSRQGVVRISNNDEGILRETTRCFRRFGFSTVIERAPRRASSVRLMGGLREQLRFLHLVNPAISRKKELEGSALKHALPLRVEAIEPIGKLTLMDITTGTGDFIANGVVSHNCYARPTHEYLGFGAGTDFERKIVVKKDAPELLRKALRSPKWKREPVMFSGVTDCYQPLEASMELTRQCLQVCLEENTPAALITKSALVERDVDVLAKLAKGPGVRVTISIPFIDEEQARAIEPYAPSPSRRLKAISNLSKAGMPVGVNVAPIIPGLSDEQMPRILEAAKAAGARWAGWVMLRLPGHVKEVFEERLREKLPLRAEKVLARLRETHGGKLYDATFGKTRMKGNGPYADAMAVLFDRTCEKLGYEDVDYLVEAPPEQLGLFEK